MSVIEVQNITKNYGHKKGVFNLSFTVEKGEVVGFLGPNGAGKTTTIRQLMGFIKPNKGEVRINGYDCFKQAYEIQKNLGYLPGEIAFMDDMTGNDFIKFVGQMKGITDFGYARELKDFFELNAMIKIRKMSKGMKQKIGIICALMQDPDILILDEPTSGLDPLMQSKFVELILNLKSKNKTILMSSHIFEEVENTCDKVIIIKEGCLVANESMEKIKKAKHKTFELTFCSNEEARKFKDSMKYSEIKENKVVVHLKGNIKAFLKNLSRFNIDDINIRTQSLEELFMHYYGGDK
ncbi:ABC transporter ATP-binding protein [Haloimpatiens sp. FM7315]|uniref:ABC transporter ATP-binding protein n=1 Tax=Haloimpatiens sp. FM7315 TaxID=3298609 RepID=UPI00370B2B4A